MRIEFILTFWIIVTIQTNLLSQATYDNNWILGYGYLENNQDQYIGGVAINFDDNQIHIEYFETGCYSDGAAVISNAFGQLKLYSDGCRIFNRHHSTILGGDTIAYSSIWDIYSQVGYPGIQNHMVLPWPGDTTKYILFYNKYNDLFTISYLLYAIIQFDSEYPDGHVLIKDVEILKEAYNTVITAVRHGNGRDWWLVLPLSNSNKFVKILLNNSGPEVLDTQIIGNIWEPREGAGQSIFTPDGKKYIRFNAWKGLDIFDFDRCSGQLSSPIESEPLSDPVVVGGGVAVSANSRYLYLSNIYKLYQFDLQAKDILASRILIDTFDGFGDPFPNTFYFLSLASDEKIYVFSSNGKKSLHVIEKPEFLGAGCRFKQHSISLPAYISFHPNNIPYFRLGPDDGSVCDTLGLNNEPVAYFRNEVNGENDHVFSLTNLSYFNPEEFHWDFGDGQSSTAEDPDSVQYLEDGFYQVCLQVSNAYGSDEYCQTIQVGDGIVGVDPLDIAHPSLNPNPFHDALVVRSEAGPESLWLDLYDMFGRHAHHTLLVQPVQEVPLTQLPPGLYLYTISNQEDQVLETGRVVKVQ